MQKTRAIEIKLQGQKIVLKSMETDAQLVEEVVDLVTMKLKEAEERTKGKGAASHQIALLALLDVAGEYVKSKRRTTDYKRQVEDYSTRIQTLLDAELKQ